MFFVKLLIDMILIDALYINNGGGKILLDYLITQLSKSNANVFYLLDDRITENHPEISPDKVQYLRGSFLKRKEFYIKNRNRFTKVFCFGNLPPNIKLKAEVFTYFHQPMYLNIPKEFRLIERLKFKLKIAILKRIAKNTDYWLVQSVFIKEKMQEKFHFTEESLVVLPFYPQFETLQTEIVREKYTYFYVSNATPHKNHIRLIEVFCEFYDKHRKGKLILTVNNSYPEVLDLINNKKEKEYPIENIGFVDRFTLQKKYLSSEFLIFPSITESFGLGLIEAVECGCMVIGADLPYTDEVCEPTLKFNPLDNNSILKALEDSLNKEDLKPSEARIHNSINQLINLLKV
jgi:glycosyltransferase involved in cell wall biosynthesis